MCGNVRGAIVLKNTIRHSNQRCVVIHGTHNLTVAENISFDTHGHCFMLEDGGEIDNMFRRNLGVLTKFATRPVSPEETDHLIPSTFWITNPKNQWVENVAGGSIDSGFWFELRDKVRGESAQLPLSAHMNPRTMRLTAFRDNVAHSNGKHGLRTYPHGFRPSEMTVFARTRSYRNKQDGIFLHNSLNLAIIGGTLADNRIQIDFDRTSNCLIDGTSVVGMSELREEVLNSHGDLLQQDEIIIGIEIHGFTIHPDQRSTTIRNIEFSGFDFATANRRSLVRLDDDMSNLHLSTWIVMKNNRIQGHVTPVQFDFISALRAGLQDVYIIDLDSSMIPDQTKALGASTIVSNSISLTTFIDSDKCEQFREQGYVYCQRTCIRSIKFAVNPLGTDHLTLRIVNEAGSFVDYPGKFPFRSPHLKAERYFVAALPNGRYEGTFVDQRGHKVWPSHVEVSLGDTPCLDTISQQSVRLEKPPILVNECQQLIRNGDFDSEPLLWLHQNLEVTVSQRGRNNSNALMIARQSKAPLIGQFLDTRCLVRRTQYQVEGWVRLDVLQCEEKRSCPQLSIRIREIVAGTEHRDRSIKLISYFVRPLQTNWNFFQGVFTVDGRISSAVSAAFAIEFGELKDSVIVDSVSITGLDQTCDDLVFNGDFRGGSSVFWYAGLNPGRATLDIERFKGRKVLRMTKRTHVSQSPTQDIRIGCLETGDWLVALARVRVENPDGTLHSCDPTRVGGNQACPRMKLKAFVDFGLATQFVATHDGGSIAITDHGLSGDGWHTMTGRFRANRAEASADKLQLFFDQIPGGKNFVISTVSVRQSQETCNQLFMNGDFELAETPQFWRTWVAGGGAQLTRVTVGEDNHGLRVSMRRYVGDGFHQFVDPSCLDAGTSWKLVGRMKLIDRNSKNPLLCDASTTSLNQGCPPVRLAGWRDGMKTMESRIDVQSGDGWSPDRFNRFEFSFVVTSTLAVCDRVSIGIRGYSTDWELLVENIVVRRN